LDLPHAHRHHWRHVHCRQNLELACKPSQKHGDSSVNPATKRILVAVQTRLTQDVAYNNSTLPMCSLSAGNTESMLNNPLARQTWLLIAPILTA
jgi:hypothetical protein